MTKEEKELLLKDLCARLPYGIYANLPNHHLIFHRYNIYEFNAKNEWTTGILYRAGREEIYGAKIEDIQPYLRPMSSMTENERKEFIECAGYEIEESVNGRHYEYFLKDFCGTPDNPSANVDGVDWLIAHHFDYRGLIEKGLALEAPEGMYKTNRYGKEIH